MDNVLDGGSLDIEQVEREKLMTVFPQCFAEGKLDIDKLLSMCGEYIDNDFEKYKFEWKGKSDSLKLAQQRSMGTLRPCPEESVDWDATDNLYIEGDNLEVLKLLQTAYYRKVKMIYIDPPYNTGNDFVYEDDFKDPIARYKEVTAQTTKSNPETMGRFHTNWLNMMYPRLRLAYNLLRDDGVIFISIDDNEVHNLRKVCDEVFGEENFRNQIIVRRGAKSVQSQFDTWDKLGQDVEHILFYTKNPNYRFPKQLKKLEEKKKGSWNNHWRGTDRPTMRYPLFGITPKSGQWRWGEQRSLNAIDNYHRMLESLCETEKSVTQEQIDNYYSTLSEDIDLLRLSKSGKPEHYIAPTDYTLLNSSWYDLLIGSSSEVLELFDTKVFDTAKLTTVIERMLNFCDKDSLILDFFSGSGTTAHAVMQLNAEDGGNRRFIMVQLPEQTDEKSEAYKAGYKNICEIGKERIRRAGAKIKAEWEKEKKDTTLFAGQDEQKASLDTGFKVFKLDSSNLKTWDPTPIEDTREQLELFVERLNAMIDTVKFDRTDLDVVYEVMLKLGVPLDYPVIRVEIGDNDAYCIGEECLLMVCLEEQLTTEIIEKIVEEYLPAKIVLSKKSFADDTALANVHYLLKDREIELKLV